VKAFIDFDCLAASKDKVGDTQAPNSGQKIDRDLPFGALRVIVAQHIRSRDEIADKIIQYIDGVDSPFALLRWIQRASEASHQLRSRSSRHKPSCAEERYADCNRLCRCWNRSWNQW
jgi:hypothetical protein